MTGNAWQRSPSSTLIPTAVGLTEKPTAEMPAKRTRKPKAPPAWMLVGLETSRAPSPTQPLRINR
jgi:hypothetical protein